MTPSREGLNAPGFSDDQEFEGALNRAYQAVRDGDIADLEVVLKGEPRLTGNLAWSLPLLDRAVDHGHPGVVAALLRAGIPANGVGDGGVTLLMRAAWAGHTELIRLLLNAGADPDVLPEKFDPEIPPEHHGQSALFCAMDRGYEEASRLLKKATSPKIRKLARKALEQVRQQGEGDEEIFGPRPQSRAEMALLLAIFQNQPEGIGPALADGADIDRRIWQDKTLLWAAAFNGNRPLTRLLLDHGANPNAPGDPQGQTPLIIAVRMGHGEVIADLMAVGADPDRADAGGLTAWDYARRPLCQDGGEALRRACRETHGTEPPEAEPPLIHPEAQKWGHS